MNDATLMHTLSIGEVAQRAGLRPSALRYYERLGLLPQPARLRGRRRYDPSILQRLYMIGLAQDAGFSLQEIRLFLDGASTQAWRELVQTKLQEVEAALSRNQAMHAMLHRALTEGNLQGQSPAQPELDDHHAAAE